MKKILLLTLFAMLALVPLANAAPIGVLPPKAKPQPVEVVKIGVSIGLTGPLALIGNDEIRGIRMAVDELNAEGVVINGKPVTIAIELFDDATDIVKAGLGVHYLNDRKVVAAIANSRSAVTISTAAQYNRLRIAQVTPNGTTPKFTEMGFDTTFRPLTNDAFQSQELVNYARDLGVKTVVTVDNGDASGVYMTQAFAKKAPDAGIKVLSHEQTSTMGFGATDYSAIITRIRSLNPDAILLGGSYDLAAPFIIQAHRLGLKETKFLFGPGSCLPNFAYYTNYSDLTRMYCTNNEPKADGTGYQKFKAKYKLLYKEQTGPFAPYAYDSVYLIVRAMQLAGSTDREAIIKALHQIDWTGITGRKQFTESGELTHPHLTRHTFDEKGNLK